jgi:response regulator RpfG family c-di-GMP phosphodiesterase
MPAQLLYACQVPAPVLLGAQHMYERYDGNGFPKKLRGDAIPILSRLLSIVDSFTDLCLNVNNAFRRQLPITEATAALRSYPDKVFDLRLVDDLESLMLTE